MLHYTEVMFAMERGQSTLFRGNMIIHVPKPIQHKSLHKVQEHAEKVSKELVKQVKGLHVPRGYVFIPFKERNQYRTLGEFTKYLHKTPSADRILVTEDGTIQIPIHVPLQRDIVESLQKFAREYSQRIK